VVIEQEIQIAELIINCQKIKGKLLTIGTAESATGGKIAAKLINVAGSSAYFKGSIVAYSDEIKINVLGVKKETIEIYGAVSQETALEMAQSARQLLNVDICIADTGIAGPTGGSSYKPVGLFYIGLASSSSTMCNKIIIHGNREENREKVTEISLNLLNQFLSQYIQEI
jgi:nicotinamide-nucleotide amidase